MTSNELFDSAIVGGGLAGLSLSIQLAKRGYKVALFEKEKYPFHKVCGEYISMESWNFLEGLGLPLKEMNLPIIKKLIVSSANGKKIETDLSLGGFGISRHTLDNQLYKIAKQNRVVVFEETKVNDIVFTSDLFTISTSSFNIQSKTAVGSFGKRSNLDAKWAREFTLKKPNKLNNYIGIKYHVKASLPSDTISLHNFKNGYCGVSKIEDDKFCVCYLTTAQNLKENNNSIKAMEENVIQNNFFLKKIFSESAFLFQSPLIISQISFEEKSLIDNNVLMIGDAAGMITPLCGNGMSMAFHSSKIAFECLDSYLQKIVSRKQMEGLYKAKWNKLFSKRLKNGRIIQYFFRKVWFTNIFISAIKPFHFITKKLISSTHGQPF